MYNNKICSDPFWLNDPFILFQNVVILPNSSMTSAEKLNALTRMLILVCFLLYLNKNQYVGVVFTIGIITIVVLRLYEIKNKKNIEQFSAHRGQFDPCRNCSGQDSTLPYINYKYETTPENQYTHLNDGLRSYTHAKYTVKPVDTPAPYREVWRNKRNYYNEYTMYPESYDISPNYTNVPYPNPILSDSITVENTSVPAVCRNPGLKKGMRPRQGSFIYHSNTFRNNVMGEIVDQFNRERNHLCPVFKPGRKTF